MRLYVIVLKRIVHSPFKKLLKIKEIKNLDTKIGSLSKDIPIKIIKEFGDIFTIYITEDLYGFQGFIIKSKLY